MSESRIENDIKALEGTETQNTPPMSRIEELLHNRGDGSGIVTESNVKFVTHLPDIIDAKENVIYILKTDYMIDFEDEHLDELGYMGYIKLVYDGESKFVTLGFLNELIMPYLVKLANRKPVENIINNNYYNSYTTDSDSNNDYLTYDIVKSTDAEADIYNAMISRFRDVEKLGEIPIINAYGSDDSNNPYFIFCSGIPDNYGCYLISKGHYSTQIFSNYPYTSGNNFKNAFRNSIWKNGSDFTSLRDVEHDFKPLNTAVSNSNNTIKCVLQNRNGTTTIDNASSRYSIDSILYARDYKIVSVNGQKYIMYIQSLNDIDSITKTIGGSEYCEFDFYTEQSYETNGLNGDLYFKITPSFGDRLWLYDASSGRWSYRAAIYDEEHDIYKVSLNSDDIRSIIQGNLKLYGYKSELPEGTTSISFNIYTKIDQDNITNPSFKYLYTAGEGIYNPTDTETKEQKNIFATKLLTLSEDYNFVEDDACNILSIIYQYFEPETVYTMTPNNVRVVNASSKNIKNIQCFIPAIKMWSMSPSRIYQLYNIKFISSNQTVQLDYYEYTYSIILTDSSGVDKTVIYDDDKNSWVYQDSNEPANIYDIADRLKTVILHYRNGWESKTKISTIEIKSDYQFKINSDYTVADYTIGDYLAESDYNDLFEYLKKLGDRIYTFEIPKSAIEFNSNKIVDNCNPIG